MTCAALLLGSLPVIWQIIQVRSQPLALGGPNGVGGRLEYSSELFERSTAARMADHFQVLLEGLAADPDAPISTVPMLTAEERQ